MSRYIDADALIDFLDVGHLRHPSELCFSEVDVANLLFHAPTISPDEVRGVGCEVCNYDKPLPKEGLSHDFYIHDGAIYHYDSELGWEGTDIVFCPFCGKRLRMKGAEDGTTE